MQQSHSCDSDLLRELCFFLNCFLSTSFIIVFVSMFSAASRALKDANLLHLDLRNWFLLDVAGVGSVNLSSDLLALNCFVSRSASLSTFDVTSTEAKLADRSDLTLEFSSSPDIRDIKLASSATLSRLFS